MSLEIEIKNLTKCFGNKKALDSLNLFVPKGSIFGLIGSNGSGKTTTIKILLGLLKPTNGSALISGLDSYKDGNKIRAQVNVLFEDPGMYNWMNGKDNIFIAGRLHNISSVNILRKIDEYSEILNISKDDKTIPISKLSKGNKQKWGILRALLNDPKIVFLDEPTANLDAFISADLWRHIHELSKTKNTTFFVNTHNLNEAIKNCSHIGIIDKGRIAKEGKTNSVIDVKTEYIIKFTGTPINDSQDLINNININLISGNIIEAIVTNKEEVANIVRKLVEQDKGVYEVSYKTNPLENILISLN